MSFEYLEPKSLEETISLLAKYGTDLKICAGGTDLVLKLKQNEIKPRYVANIAAISNLDYIEYDAHQGLSIGAITSLRSIERSAELRQRGYEVICQGAGQIGYVQIRNVATIGGNLCNASPSADMAPPLMALSGKARIIGLTEQRIVPLEAFFTGPGTTVLNHDEMLMEIQIPPLPSDGTNGGVYLKHSIRGPVDLTIVGVAVTLTLDPLSLLCKNVRIVLGAVAPTPIRAYRAEALIGGKNLDDRLIDEAAQVASQEARPISDVRSSAEYRTKMVTVLTRRALTASLEQASPTVSKFPRKSKE